MGRNPKLVCALSAVVMVTHSLLWFIPFYFFAVLRLIVPIRATRKFFARKLVWVAEKWILTTRLVVKVVTRTEFKVSGLESLTKSRSYFVVANHRSWADTMVLATQIGPYIPLVRFFAKRSLLWLPFFGVAFWALDFPLMHRHSKKYLEEHPEQRGKDLETTRRLCKKFRNVPVSIVNFAEGTRFSDEKYRAQGSPHRHLLRPRAGGIAFAVAAMEGRVDRILDLTIVYPPGPVSFLRLFGGEMKKIVLEVKERPVPAILLQGDYSTDPAHRDRVQAWLREIWEEKDERIEKLRAAEF